MYAVIETGGKQYRVAPGDVIDVERTALAAGDTDEADKKEAGQKETGKKKARKGKPRKDDAPRVEFGRVLLVASEDGIQVGGPLIEGASVKAVLVKEVRGPKLLVFKKKRRKGYKRLRGHRQDLLRVKIEEILS